MSRESRQLALGLVLVVGLGAGLYALLLQPYPSPGVLDVAPAARPQLIDERFRPAPKPTGR